MIRIRSQASLFGLVWVSPPIQAIQVLHALFGYRSNTSAGTDTTTTSARGHSSWRWSTIPRSLKQNLTKSSLEDFPKITISLPFPTSSTSQHSLKKFIDMLQVCFEYSLLPVNRVSRWEPVTSLRRPFVSNIVNS